MKDNEWDGTEAEHLEDSMFSVEIDGDELEELSFHDDIRHKLARHGRGDIGGKQKVRRADGSVAFETVVKEVNGRVITSERQEEMKRLYEAGKAAKVGTEIVCPVCREKHIKTTYHKVFCSNGRKTRKDCKSKYWNMIHPERLDRIY